MSSSPASHDQLELRDNSEMSHVNGTSDPYLVVGTLPSWSYPLVCAYLLVVGVFGVASNVAIVIVFVKNSVVSHG